MGITVNTEKQTKTQGPNIKTPTDIGNSSKQRQTNQKHKDPTLTQTDNGIHSKHR